MIDEQTLEWMGFNYLKEQLELNNAYGKTYMQDLSFLSNACLNQELVLLEEMIKFTSCKNNKITLQHTLMKFKDISSTIKRCLNGAVLDLVELFEIKRQAINTVTLSHLIFGNQFDNVRDIISLLSEEGKHEMEFYIYDSYSSKLSEIRREKKRWESEYYRSDETKRVEILNKRSQYVLAEEEEEILVRQKLSRMLQPLIAKMDRHCQLIGHIDVLYAKAILSIKYQGIKPEFDLIRCEISGMIHPKLIDELGKGYMKNTIELTCGSTVITGANMSGKSSVLKTLALNIFLGRCGFYVFANKAVLPLVDNLVYLGAQDELRLHGLSSFGHEIKQVNNVIASLKKQFCLVIVDEFARSTNPNEGQKFVKALTAFCNRHSSITVIATHFDQVGAYANAHYQIKGLKEHPMGNSPLTIGDIKKYMDYSLVKVELENTVPKEAYSVAILLGLDADFLSTLNQFYRE